MVSFPLGLLSDDFSGDLSNWVTCIDGIMVDTTADTTFSSGRGGFWESLMKRLVFDNIVNSL